MLILRLYSQRMNGRGSPEVPNLISAQFPCHPARIPWPWAGAGCTAQGEGAEGRNQSLQMEKCYLQRWMEQTIPPVHLDTEQKWTGWFILQQKRPG